MREVASQYGFLLNLASWTNYQVQVYISHSGYAPRYRTRYGSGWSAWRLLSS